MKIESDTRRRRVGRAPREDARQPGHDPDPEPRLRELGGADEPVAGGRRGRGGAPAAAGPCRPRRDPEVRLQRRPQRARARERTRDRGARGVRARWRRAFLADFGVQVFSHVVQIGSVRAETRRRPRAGRLRRRWTSHRFAASTTPRATRWSRRSTRPRKANESLGGVFEVRAYGLVPGIGSYVSWEAPDGRPARAGDHVDPGDEGRERRRRVRHRRAGRLGGA